MGRYFIDGFEGGGIDLWDAHNNATVISSVGKDMDGDYCLDLVGYSDWVSKNLDAANEYYFAVLWRPHSINSRGILSVWNGGSRLCVIRHNSGHLEAHRLTTWLVSGTAGVSFDTTYLIEVYFKIHDTTGKIQVKINGILDIDFTGDTKPGTDTEIDVVRLGDAGYVNAFYSDAHFDNLIADTANWIGDTNIQALAPTAGGNATNWTPSAGSNFDCVNDIPASDVGYISTNANSIIDTYVTGDLAGSVTAVKCVQIQSRAVKDGTPTPNNLNLVARCNSTDYFSGSNAVPVSYVGLHNLWELNPDDSAAWEVADVNGMQIGIRSAA